MTFGPELRQIKQGPAKHWADSLQIMFCSFEHAYNKFTCYQPNNIHSRSCAT